MLARLSAASSWNIYPNVLTLEQRRQTDRNLRLFRAGEPEEILDTSALGHGRLDEERKKEIGHL